MAKNRVLVVDDEPSLSQYLRTLLELYSYDVEIASGGKEALQRLEHAPTPDVILLDVLMPDIDGLQTLEQIRKRSPDMRVVMLSCVNDTRKVVQAARLGCYEYLSKPCSDAELHAVLQCSLADRVHTDRPPVASIIEEISPGQYFVAASEVMRNIRAQLPRLANINVPVLVLGESGSGKEVIARLIHNLSARSHRAFLKVNCAALPPDLLESELFGYEAGAFTGATHAKPGKFELCNHGTILLDEIGEMPTSLQAKLLQVLQDQQFSRLGGRALTSVDVRIIAATNIDVQQAIEHRKFRQDLYYRLNAFTICLPPLRERREEIPLLLQQMMARFSDRYARPPLPISRRMLESCMAYHWPGNLREVENFVKRYLVLEDEAMVLRELDSTTEARARLQQTNAPRSARGDLKSMVKGLKDQAELEAITRALEETNWNRKAAARILNISYKALLYKTRQYAIDDRPDRGFKLAA